MADDLDGFDPDDFRDQITNTMVMGLPVPVEERPTFHFPGTDTFPVGTPMTPEGRPVDPRIAPATSTSKDPVQVPCAVEFATDSTNDTGLAGAFWQTRATLTLLDIHYAQVKDATEVDLAGRRYLIQEMTNVGLSTVTVYTLTCFRKGVETG